MNAALFQLGTTQNRGDHVTRGALPRRDVVKHNSRSASQFFNTRCGGEPLSVRQPSMVGFQHPVDTRAADAVMMRATSSFSSSESSIPVLAALPLDCQAVRIAANPRWARRGSIPASTFF